MEQIGSLLNKSLLQVQDSDGTSPDSLTLEERTKRLRQRLEQRKKEPERCVDCGAVLPGNHKGIRCQKCYGQYRQIMDKIQSDSLQERITRNIAKSGLHERLLSKTFTSYSAETKEQERILKAAYNYYTNFEQYKKQGLGLLLEGKNGTGKTHITAAIANGLLQCGVSVVCKSSTSLLCDIRDTYNRVGAREKEALQPFIDCRLLIIDDFGKQQASEWSTTTLFNLLNERYERLNPTIITTNYNLSGLEKALTFKGSDGETEKAIISRLKEMCIPLTLVWEDYRNRKWEGA